MIILSIETSCDDTGVAVVEKRGKKLKRVASVVSSQDEIHKKWGGVYPFEAKREHQKNIIPSLLIVLKKANLLEKGSMTEPKDLEEILSREKDLLKDVRLFFQKNKIKKIDAIAVTVGPGLEPCLWVGVNFARALSAYLNTPIIPVNHIKGHLLFFLFEREKIKFPAIALVASGGHTEIVLAKSMSSFSLIGKTRDDAAGECFDKAARVLGLPYPGGPAISNLVIEKEKENFKPIYNIKLPRPMKNRSGYDFSFSGLKTAVLYDFLSRNKKEQKDERYIYEMAKETEEAITDVLIFKFKKAIKEYGAKTAILGGGVTANKKLQKKVKELEKELPKTEFIYPERSLSTDNAEMIGAAASIDKTRKKYNEVVADSNLKIYGKI